MSSSATPVRSSASVLDTLAVAVVNGAARCDIVTPFTNMRDTRTQPMLFVPGTPPPAPKSPMTIANERFDRARRADLQARNLPIGEPIHEMGWVNPAPIVEATPANYISACKRLMRENDILSQDLCTAKRERRHFEQEVNNQKHQVVHHQQRLTLAMAKIDENNNTYRTGMRSFLADIQKVEAENEALKKEKEDLKREIQENAAKWLAKEAQVLTMKTSINDALNSLLAQDINE
jgi:hypothetical protein